MERLHTAGRGNGQPVDNRVGRLQVDEQARHTPRHEDGGKEDPQDIFG